MKEQIQAETHLQVQSQQLTHYLNDWLIEDSRRGLAKIKSTLNIAKKLDKEEKNVFVKDREKKEEKEKTEVCRIQFPIIEERSKSSKDLILPLIKPRNNIYIEERKARLRMGHSEQKLSYTPASLIFKNGLTSSGSTETYQKQMIRKFKRKRKRSPNARNPENNQPDKQLTLLDVTQIKAKLIKQLKNSRKSAQKDKNFRSHKEQPNL